MTNDIKLVKDVFKDYDSKGDILNCQIVNVSIYKKSSKLVIDLKSQTNIQIGEKLAFEYYLKSRFRVNEAMINIEESVPSNTTKAKKSDNDTEEDNSPIIIGNKKMKFSDKIIKVKDINMDSGRVTICGKIIKEELKELKTR